MSDRSGWQGFSDMEQARRRLGLSALDLWVGYFAVGGNASLVDVETWLSGAAALPTTEHNLLAQALNDQFSAIGQNHPVPYRDATG